MKIFVKHVTNVNLLQTTLKKSLKRDKKMNRVSSPCEYPVSKSINKKLFFSEYKLPLTENVT